MYATSYRLNSTAASLLGCLHEGPMTGWDLAATAQRAIGSLVMGFQGFPARSCTQTVRPQRRALG